MRVPDPSQRLTDLPLRIRAAATAVENGRRAERGLPESATCLVHLPEAELAALMELVCTILDAAHEAERSAPIGPASYRIGEAAQIGKRLHAQAIVLVDVAQNGVVTTSTWAESGGRKSLAIAEWARGLQAGAIAAVPFQTIFGMGFGGKPTPLTMTELASLSGQRLDYAVRNSGSEE